MKNGLVYLNGHLHLAFGKLYFRHSDGLLELELADWKDNRRLVFFFFSFFFCLFNLITFENFLIKTD